jgi:hypothetical protein
MNPNGRMNEIVGEALKRLGTPSRENLDAACERIRENMRSTNPADMTPLPLLDTRPASLWGLRQPFLIAGGVVIAFAALTATTFWIRSGRSPAPSVSKVAVEPRSGSTAPVNQAESRRAVAIQRSGTTTAPDIGTPTSRAKAIKGRAEAGG